MASISQPREIYEQAKSTILLLLASLILIAFISPLITNRIIKHLVIDRVLALKRRIKQFDSNTQQNFENLEGEDEIRELGESFRQLISELQLSEHDARLAQDSAEKANQAKSQFLANMSHEIRTPMTAILGYTQLIASQQNFNNDTESYLRHINTSGELLLTLINDMLDLSRIEQGSLQINYEHCNIEELIASTIDMFNIIPQEKNITLAVAYHTPLYTFIHADKIRLQQVLINLIGNALKFTEEGNITVSVTLEPRDNIEPYSHLLELRVKDTGIGIAKENSNRIFEAFEQEDSSTTRRFGGTGLGLSISKQIIEAMHGTIDHNPEYNDGSEFIVILPTTVDGELLQAKGISLVPSAAIQNKSKTEADALNQPALRLLLAEDNPVNRLLFKRVLENAGYEVDAVENGLQALEQAEHASYAAAVFDMQMPIMDGYTAAQSLRSHYPHLPIIALTAHAMDSDKQRCLEAGCNAYLTKPLNQPALLAELDLQINRAHPT